MTEGAPHEASREGQLLAGKYQLERHLGSGAMGDVYRAQNTMLGRVVAIKLLRPEHAHNREIVDRFLREARAANMVRHPNVVDMLDVGQDEHGSPYIVQEFLEGQDLAHYIESSGGRLPPSEAIEHLLPVVEAIEFAHARGVVHRDLKPENIFLALEGTRRIPKLLDFGISQVRSNDSVRMTATGLMMGTPAYMSPEQIVRGAREADAQTDVWALGVILFEVLSGELPFMAETASALFVDIATKDAPSLADVDPTLPADLVRIVARCLRRERSERYPSGCELARDLRHWVQNEPLEGTGVRSIPPPGPSGDAAAVVLAGRDVPSLGHGGVAPKERTEAPPVPNAPHLGSSRKERAAKAVSAAQARAPTSQRGEAAPPSREVARPMATMQEALDADDAFADDDDMGPGLELDVPRAHGTNSQGQRTAHAPAASRGARGENAPMQRVGPPARRIPEGFHKQPSGAMRGAGMYNDAPPLDQGPSLSLNDVVGYTALAVGGIVAAGISRYVAHAEGSAINEALEPLRGNTLFVVPGLVAAFFALYAGWLAGSNFRAEAKVKAGVLACLSGVMIATALECFGAM